MIIIPMLDIEYMGIYFVLFVALIVSGYVYLISFQPIVKSAKCLKRLVWKIQLMIFRQTQLCRNQNLLWFESVLFKKPFTVVPYSEIAWVYMQVNKAYGITVAKQVHIYCRNGKHFILRADVEEIKWLLGSCLLKFNQNIIIGYGFEQKSSIKKLKRLIKINIRVRGGIHIGICRTSNRR